MKSLAEISNEIFRKRSHAVSHRHIFWLFAVLAFNTNSIWADLDVDGNTLSDVWQRKYGVGAISAAADGDGDGFTNYQEFLFATDPLSSSSRPGMVLNIPSAGVLDGSWYGERGKTYVLQASGDLSIWLDQTRQVGQGKTLFTSLEDFSSQRLFTRVQVSDVDTDSDGLSDWEEIATGYNPKRIYSEGLGNTSNSTNDKTRLTSSMNASNVITVAAADSNMVENWPDPGRFVIRRAGNPNALTVNFALSGTAASGTDYSSPGGTVTIPFGADEAAINIAPLLDNIVESNETITLTLLVGTGYALNTDALKTTATLNLTDSDGLIPATKAAARFLTQSTFGPTAAEIDRVKSLGYASWIEDQFLRTPNLHMPIMQEWRSELQTTPSIAPVVNIEHRMEAWWRQAMRSDAASDPLRQRMAFALSQIFVISDRMDSLSSDQRGMTAYYDVLLSGAFGTYRQLLENVTRNPWMGLYLSSLRNRKANLATNRFPDENFAREVMQLFSIGLWRLNPDGTQILSNGSDLGPDGETIPAGQPIPSYGQVQISEIARVFTGMSYSTRFTSTTDDTQIPTTDFVQTFNVSWQPMRMFDTEHDIDEKSINLPGVPPLNLPARTANGSTAGDADLTAFLDYLSDHPNVGPFISRLLIQRLVTSNPSPAYVGRVSSAFNDNGSGVRGDLKAVIRAILLDSDARDYSRLSIPSHGLVREPYTRYVGMARALEAAPADPSAGGRYRGFGTLDVDFAQRPLSAPSVFNFYSPNNQPAGPLRDARLASPEMQITNSVTSITGPNRYSRSLNVLIVRLNTNPIPTNSGWTQMNNIDQIDNTTTAVNEALWNTRINEAFWLALPAADLAPDAMVGRLDELLCYGNMGQPTFRAVTRALERISDPFLGSLTAVERSELIRSRLRLAVHLITTSADYAVLK